MNPNISSRLKDLLRPGYRLIKSSVIELVSFTSFQYQRLSWLLQRPRFPDNNGNVFVNLGCGQTNHSRFINIDLYPHRHVHYLHRIDRLPMFTDDKVDLIYASHCLEHFRYAEIEQVLREWFRVLKPGGVLRLSVPDFDRLLCIYQNTGNPDDIVEQLMGGQNNPYNFHYVLFNRRNLTEKLLSLGFIDVLEWTPGNDDLTTFDDYSVFEKDVAGNSYKISLNIEAKKK